MVMLAVLFVAAGLGVAGAGLFASRAAIASHAHSAMSALESVPTPRAGLIYRLAEPLGEAGARGMRKLSPVQRLDLTRRRIIYAGLEGKVTLEQILAYKAVAAVAGLVFGLFIHPHQFPGILAGVVVAVLASFVPDVWLDGRARERQRAIARTLPDALDLLAITVEAGLGLEQALTVVTDRLDGPLGDELRRMMREIELGVGRRTALEFLRKRTDVRELSAFIVALLQAEELGMAVGEVLRVQAAQVRLVRRQTAREQAAKTPVKILFPVIFTIFPAMFVITIGPGAIQIYRTIFHI
ncbi:MAG TPA: type II secretion system F family protein [Mycobacteriales bacterium]|jgi:tight adherence protein C|nr:type II secretion system F family protein [Mycobacteriales bacterium]